MRRYGTAAILAAALALAGCGKPEAGLVPSDYREWRRTTDIELDYPVPGHGDNYRVIYMNDTGIDAGRTVRDGKDAYVYPDGTVVVKEIYSGRTKPAPDAVPDSLTVMIKNTGNPAAQDGWMYLMKDMKTGTERRIDSRFCAECHDTANGAHPYGDGNSASEFRDYIFFPPETSGANPLQPAP